MKEPSHTLKKIKDLTLEEVNMLCKKHHKDCFNDKCPLRIDGLCFGIIQGFSYKKIIEKLEIEVEVDE